MGKSLFTVSVAIFVLVGASAYWQYQKHALLVAKQQGVVKTVLYNPYSAKFRNERPAAQDQSVWCGEVSAKNQAGKTVGYTRYIAFMAPRVQVLLEQGSSKADSTTLASDVATFHSRWLMFCL